jgi:hypothetical protein
VGQKKTNSPVFLQGLEQTFSRWSAPIGFVAALILGTSVGIPAGMNIYQSWSSIEAKDRAKTGIELIQLMATIVGGVAIFWNITIARQQLTSTQEKGVTDRFSSAVEQLGHEKAVVRIGGIYALERIAQDSARDHWVIMEVLTAYIRDRRSLPVNEKLATTPLKFDRDIHSAIVVLGRRNISNDLQGSTLYLSNADLRAVSFYKDNFQNACFNCSDLREANFRGTQLQKARFWKACLAKAAFTDADLTDTDLVEADFREAEMRNCNLTGANISQANFEAAKDLTVEQVKSAQNWQEAIYDPSFAQLLDSSAS